ncbi:hypothetical protein A5724_01050 [Mycobacterium sp. ACS1612]|nr:hypothetical protein A5724_01050 [Mycobacterium sp. ACS1612]
MASVIFFALLLAVAYNIREGGDAVWLDGAVAARVHPHVAPERTKVALTLTQIGSPNFVVPATLAVALVSAVVRRSAWTGIVVIATVGLVGVGSTVGKQIITAAHPVGSAHLTEHTFPSGHVSAAVSLLGVAAIAFGAKPRHFLVWLGIAVVAAVVAATRIYLGVHWFSDTLGGVFLGCSAVFAAAALLPARKPHPP